ncbi:chromosome segregation protein [Bacillus mesophilus]|uniref:Chromosome partition protein Smc n=1 Tax=Bacillus mesophilus TaxID=1808955 RepID=A0A6M0Q1P8_9BACI|nr:chromosome segregation protein SMC [Bacillus mesophilus]MBM7659393.1 chromosome segregation protein [Bacillus mesophilus]NEY70265.1 chromosome segregation protein SMC [Bacillus mesophilus]
MFLKRLDIVGFKSFAERVSVDFVPGVTAVVGPNGSGKSNITDAIRWVLGEQSAKSLRGAKMEDIIFAGSDSRKSLNVAEVTLTLDNEDQFLPIDYHEVSVTRRVFRSGESEFQINKQTCRLKDIVDLFMDSGLGREAFSIISQGKVEEILSSKAEERRTIFEEAAGVLKYKTRKKKAESKLADAQDNLNRVEDILHELENQLEPLKIQSSIAKDYLEKKDELEKFEVALTVYEIEDLHNKWKTLLEQLEEHKDQELKLASVIQREEAQVENIRNDIRDFDESISQLQEVLLLTTGELEKLEGQKEVLKERKKNASQNRGQLEKTVQENEIKVSRYKELLITENQRLQTLKEVVKELTTELSMNEKQYGSYNENMEEQLENIKSDYIEHLNEQASKRNELSHISEQINQQKVKNERLDQSNEKYVLLRADLLERKAGLSRQLETQQEELNEHIDEYRKLQAKIEKMKEDYQKKESMLYQSYQVLQQTKSRKETLEEMQEDYSGFFQGVKEVLKARNHKLEGIDGAIAELISVPKDYETALEIALGASMQHIVVDHETNARKAIQFLKQNHYGRATFLPLSVISGKKVPEDQLRKLQSHDAFVGVAVDLITYQGKHENVISSLLGNVIITKDLKGANEIARLINYRYRLVTLDGDVVSPGGAMTGGAVKQKSNSLLGRQRELEQLTSRLEDIQEKTIKLEEYVKSLKKTILDDEALLNEQRASGEELRFKEQGLKSSIREVEVEEKSLNERLSMYDHEKEMFLADRDQMLARKTVLESELNDLVGKIAALDEDIKQLTEQKAKQQASRETLQSDITNIRIQLAERKQELMNQQEKTDRFQQELNETDQLLQITKEDLALLSSEMTSTDSGEEQLDRLAKQKLLDKNDTLQLISSRREERLQLQTKIEDIENELKEIRRQYKQLVEAVKDEEVKSNRLDVELENRLTHLREEYMLTFEAAKDKYPLTVDSQEARTKVKLIKLAIEELGSVNMGAIEEYERVSERHHFLLEQKNDLVEAKDTLYRVIGEMDEEMKKRFETTFSAIRSHFEGVFKSLFGGGRADLRLTNPEDLLNTGVDIVAQPPGKKLTNLGLLSGGERALTAIALLFSILKVRPVPFCVLDEVEAALDDANVHRFGLYLKKFSQETQFIVITHRKGTMEESDVLYGVTMQESGVSKLVSVRLEDSKELVGI